jgi:putative toxin-antitoxin system antitoxin component (TIGR02293 family)
MNETSEPTDQGKLKGAVWQDKFDILADLLYVNFMNQTVIKKRQATGRPVIRFKTRGASLGITAASTGELISQVEHGFAFKALRQLESYSGMPASMIASIIGIPERTLARRKTAGRLTSEESERLLRVSTVFEKAVELFEGDAGAAVKWLTTSQRALGNHPPIAYSRTELGAREVENLIGRLEHGVFS